MLKGFPHVGKFLTSIMIHAWVWHMEAELISHTYQDHLIHVGQVGCPRYLTFQLQDGTNMPSAGETKRTGARLTADTLAHLSLLERPLWSDKTILIMYVQVAEGKI